MKYRYRYRISIYKRFPFEESNLISQEFRRFICTDDAKIYAMAKIDGTPYLYDVQDAW